MACEQTKPVQKRLLNRLTFDCELSGWLPVYWEKWLWWQKGREPFGTADNKSAGRWIDFRVNPEKTSQREW